MQYLDFVMMVQGWVDGVGGPGQSGGCGKWGIIFSFLQFWGDFFAGWAKKPATKHEKNISQQTSQSCIQYHNVLLPCSQISKNDDIAVTTPTIQSLLNPPNQIGLIGAWPYTFTQGVKYNVELSPKHHDLNVYSS